MAGSNLKCVARRLNMVSQLQVTENMLVGESLSEPHTREKNGTNIVFTKFYVEKQINGTSIAHSQKFTFKKWLQMLQCKCSRHTKNYQSSLLTLHKRLVCAFIT